MTLLDTSQVETLDRRLDGLDAPWVGSVSRYLLLGLDAPSPEAVRAAVHGALEPGSPWARLVDADTATWRPIRSDERDGWADALVTTGPAVGTDLELASRLLDEPLGLRPFYAVVTPDALLMRVNHVSGDGVGTHALVRRMLGSGEPPMPYGETVAQVERRVLRALGRHPLRTAHTVATYRRPTAERYAPASEAMTGVEPVLVSSRTDGGWAERLLALRDERWPGASFSAVMLVGLRRALAEHVATPRPGAELLADVRRYLGEGAPELGNLARGFYVCTDDDEDPQEVSRVVKRDLDRGIPLIALAASLAVGRLRRGAGEPMVAVGGAGPRLALTYLRGLGGPVPDVFRPGGGYWTMTAPNGPEGITVLARELGDSFALDATFFPDALDPTAVRAALDHLLDDPAGVLPVPTTRTPEETA
ncbi:hypothetical protein GCM10028771_20570 [Nocardioides marmoraquaticus]